MQKSMFGVSLGVTARHESLSQSTIRKSAKRHRRLPNIGVCMLYAIRVCTSNERIPVCALAAEAVRHSRCRYSNSVWNLACCSQKALLETSFRRFGICDYKSSISSGAEVRQPLFAFNQAPILRRDHHHHQEQVKTNAIVTRRAPLDDPFLSGNMLVGFEASQG